VWIVIDWATAAATAASPTATSHNASTPGPTASPVAVQQSPNYTYYVAELDDQTSAGAVSYGITGSGTGPFTIIAIETKASAGGAADSGPNYAGTAADMGGGSGSWTNPTNAQGAADTTYAVWTSP
jgi:hypothetical protein